MRQAIETKYLGPTNHRGSRVVARAQAGRVVVAWDYERGVEGTHRAAAEAFAAKFGWITTGMVGGANAKGDGYVWVLA